MAEEIKFTISGTDKSSGAFSKAKSNIKSLAKAGAAMGASVLAAGGAILAFTNKVTQADDKTGKFATRIGVSVEALSQYQFVAAQAGVSTEQFNLATQRMTRRVAEAAQGTGEAVKALQELGISAKDFNKLPLDKQMETLSDRLGEVAGDSDKLRLAFKLFDSEGTSVIQMLNGGSEAMRAAAKDAQFLGLSISKEATAKAALFTTSMTRLRGSIKGVSRGIAGELQPLFSGLADSMANSLARNRQSIVLFVKNALVSFLSFFQIVKQVWNGIFNILSDTSAFNNFIDLIKQIPGIVGTSFMLVSKFIANGVFIGFELAKNVVLSFGKWIGEAIAQIVLGEKVTAPFERMGQLMSEGLEKAKINMLVEMADLSVGLAETAAQAGDTISDAFGVSLDEARAKAEQTIESLSLFTESAAEKIETIAEKTKTVQDLIQERQTAFETALLNNSVTFVDTLFTTANTAVDSLSQAMAGAIVEGDSLMKSFQAIAKSVLKEVVAALVKMGVQRLLVSTLNIGANKAEASADASKAIAAAGANMFASFAGAPWPISLGAPAAAAAAIAGATGAYSAGAAAGKGAATLVAHGGITNNPNEQTAIIQQGERIVSRAQNRDLTDFLSGGGNGGGQQIGTINITMFPNATNADAVFDMPPEQVRDFLAEPIIEVLDSLDRQGISPVFSDRTRNG